MLPENTTAPLGWISVGDPAEILPHEHERIWAIQKSLDFPRYVFGVERPPEGQSIMPQVMPRYAKALQNHRDHIRPTKCCESRCKGMIQIHVAPECSQFCSLRAIVPDH